jgi:hypothetical protein
VRLFLLSKRVRGIQITAIVNAGVFAIVHIGCILCSCCVLEPQRIFRRLPRKPANYEWCSIGPPWEE